jgi:glycosyltransferase 2 family protein
VTADQGRKDRQGWRLPGGKRLRGLLQVLISIILLALILRQVHWGEVAAALSQMRPAWLLLAWVLFLLGIGVRAVRWQVLLDALGVRRPLRELTAWYFVGSFFNVILPTGFGGDAVRVVELAQDTSRPGAVLNSVLVDRYMGIMVLLAMGLAAAPAGHTKPGVLALTGGLFAGGLLVAWLLRRPWWAAWGRQTGAWGRLVRALRLPALADAVAPYDARATLRSLTVSLAFNLLQIAWNVAIAWGLGLRLPLTTFLVFVPLTAVALLLPAFGGLGVRELSYVGLFGSVGVPQGTALALSLSVYAITVASGLVGGVLYLAQGARKIKATTDTP